MGVAKLVRALEVRRVACATVAPHVPLVQFPNKLGLCPLQCLVLLFLLRYLLFLSIVRGFVGADLLGEVSLLDQQGSIQSFDPRLFLLAELVSPCGASKPLVSNRNIVASGSSPVHGFQWLLVSSTGGLSQCSCLGFEATDVRSPLVANLEPLARSWPELACAQRLVLLERRAST